jgi:hypothetical protein
MILTAWMPDMHDVVALLEEVSAKDFRLKKNLPFYFFPLWAPCLGGKIFGDLSSSCLGFFEKTILYESHSGHRSIVSRVSRDCNYIDD